MKTYRSRYLKRQKHIFPAYWNAIRTRLGLPNTGRPVAPSYTISDPNLLKAIRDLNDMHD